MERTAALVTGASAGIGRELARVIAADGRHVVLAARRRAALDALAAELTGRHGVEAHVITVDLADPAGVEGLIATIERRGLAIDCLANNAGIGLVAPFGSAPPEEIERMLAINVVAPTRLARAFLPGMLARGRGCILNVGSTAAFQPGPGMAIYFASKAYLVSLSQALWSETAGTGVTVTALCPGPTRSEMAERSGLSGTRLFSGVLPVASAERVARRGYEAAMRGRRLVVDGIGNQLLVFGTRFAPTRIAMAVARALLAR